MFCSKCGCQNADNVAFCQQCGAQLSQVSEQSVNQQYQQTYAQAQQSYAPQFVPSTPVVRQSVVRSAHPVLNVLKNLGASPLFIVAIVAYSVFLLFNFISSVSGTAGILSYFYEITDMLDIPTSYFSDALNVVSGASVGMAIMGLIPNILIAVGMWMTFASAINKQDGGMKTAGLTMIKVISIINLIGSCIAAAIIEIVLLVAAINAGNSFYGSSYTGIFVVAMLIVGGIYAFIIVYQSKIISTINTIKNTIITGNASDRVSGFVAVLCFISGGFTALSIFAAHGVASVFSTLASATALICFGVFIFSYKNKMRSLIMPNMQAQNPYMQQQTQNFTSQNSFTQAPNAYSSPNEYAYQNDTTVLNNDDANNQQY